MCDECVMSVYVCVCVCVSVRMSEGEDIHFIFCMYLDCICKYSTYGCFCEFVCELANKCHMEFTNVFPDTHTNVTPFTNVNSVSLQTNKPAFANRVPFLNMPAFICGCLTHIRCLLQCQLIT